MLFLKLIRDIKKNMLGSATIIIITALGIMMWSGFEGIATNGIRITGGFYEEYAMPDLFVTGNRLSESDIRDIGRNGGDTVMGRNVFDMTVPDLDDAVIRVYAQEMPPALNKPAVITGSDAGADSPRNIMLNDSFMTNNNIRPGDQIKLFYNNHNYYFTVTAGVRTPENIYLLKNPTDLFPDYKGFGYALLSESAVWNILYDGQEGVYNQIVLTSPDPKATKTYISDKLSGKVLSVLDHSEHLSASMVDLEFSSIESMVGIFPTVFFIIAALVSFTSIKRLVDKERVTIGTMKALGVSSGAVLAHYTSHGLLYGSVAALVGIPLGILIPRAMFVMFNIFFLFPPYELALDYNTSFTAAAVAILVSVFSVFWACRSTLTLSPSVCMRPKSGKPGKKVLVERLTIVWNRLGDIQKIVIRNMFRNKDRFIMSVFGVTCSCALLFIAFGIRSSVDVLLSVVYEKVNMYDMKVYFTGDATKAQANRIVNLDELERGELLMETGAKLTGSTSVQKSASITIAPDDTQLLGIYDGRDLSVPLPADGCIISDILARDLGVSEGDDVYVSITGRKKDFPLRVNKIIVLNFGQGVFLGETAWRNTGEGFFPTSALINLKGSTDRELFQADINDRDYVLDAMYQSQLKEKLTSDMEMMNISVSIMILFAGVMAFIVLFNLGTLNFYEREREIATLKVVGFFNNEVKQMAFGENYIFVTIGCVLGMFLGNIGLAEMLAMSATEHYNFTIYVSPSAVIYCILTLYGFALLTNMFLARYIKKIDMISSLKAIE